MRHKSLLKPMLGITGMLLQCLLYPGAANAAEAPTENLMVESTGAWLQAVGEGSMDSISPSLSKNARVWVEGQTRFNDNFNHWYQGMVRTALGYSISDRATIWAGYTWLPTQNLKFGTQTNGNYVAQQDVWPAFRYILPTDHGTFMFRTMWETNFGVGSQVRERPRQMIKYTLPIGFDNKLSFITWDEVFVRVNNTDWGGRSGFDQNRGFAGFGWAFNKTVRTELGYMNQYLDDANHRNNYMYHLAMASVFVNF